MTGNFGAGEEELGLGCVCWFSPKSSTNEPEKKNIGVTISKFVTATVYLETTKDVTARL